MTEPKTFTPQEPGVIAAVEISKIDALAAGSVGDLAEALDGLADPELEQLHAAELQGKARTTAIAAIEREQARRLLDTPNADTEIVGSAVLGDANSYASMRAAEIDPAKLTDRVLTLDGWLHPRPAAEPKA